MNSLIFSPLISTLIDLFSEVSSSLPKVQAKDDHSLNHSEIMDIGHKQKYISMIHNMKYIVIFISQTLQWVLRSDGI